MQRADGLLQSRVTSKQSVAMNTQHSIAHESAIAGVECCVLAGKVWQGRAGMARRGVARHGAARHGRQGEDRIGRDCRGLAGEARQGRQGVARLGAARRGRAWQARHGKAGQGSARLGRQGKAGLGLARLGKAWQAWLKTTTLKTHMRTKTKREHFAPTTGSGLNKTQAEKVGATLKQIEKKNGAIKPDIVVDHARPESSPLHEFFTWDDTAAAEKCRLDEASRLIRSIRLIKPDMPTAEQPIIRAFVNVKASDDERNFEGKGYISFARSQTVESYRDQVLANAKSELQSWARRYKDLQEFSAVYAAIDSVEV
jgi:hypothetical protein